MYFILIIFDTKVFRIRFPYHTKCKVILFGIYTTNEEKHHLTIEEVSNERHFRNKRFVPKNKFLGSMSCSCRNGHANSIFETKLIL